MACLLRLTSRYIVERKGVLKYLIPGVCFNFLAVIINTITYKHLSVDQKRKVEQQALLEEGEKQDAVGFPVSVDA